MSRIRYTLFAVVLCLLSFAVMALPVDINQADAKTIAKELTGVGSARAEAIVSYRQQYGPFKRPEDLLQVKGIGKAILEKNRSAIVLTSEKADVK